MVRATIGAHGSGGNFTPACATVGHNIPDFQAYTDWDEQHAQRGGCPLHLRDEFVYSGKRFQEPNSGRVRNSRCEGEVGRGSYSDVSDDSQKVRLL
jgi:hypothetical protein